MSPGLVAIISCGILAMAAAVRAEPAVPEAPADGVLVLPLEAERSLELYGQPVASELARALVAGDVAAVSHPRTPQDRSRLVVDGTVAPARAGAVTISLRVRQPPSGAVVETLTATASSLETIDAAVAELSARLLRVVRDRLASGLPAARSLQEGSRAQPSSGGGSAPASPSSSSGLLVAVADGRRGSRTGAMPGALEAAIADWARAQHHQVQKLDPAKLEPKLVAKTVEASGARLALGFWLLDYAAEGGAVPMARARVRVRLSDARGVAFDRVVATDTVVGDRGLPAEQLAARVAREVLAILRPHLRRQGWSP
jgi:hypothetical protein